MKKIIFFNFFDFFVNFHDFKHFKLLLKVKFCVDSENLIYFNMKIDLYVKILIFYVKNDFLMIFYDFYDVFDDFNDFLSILNRLKTQKFIWIWKI